MCCNTRSFISEQANASSPTSPPEEERWEESAGSGSSTNRSLLAEFGIEERRRDYATAFRVEDLFLIVDPGWLRGKQKRGDLGLDYVTPLVLRNADTNDNGAGAAWLPAFTWSMPRPPSS